jgi:predicted PurR-regulated permease PerM
MQSTGSADLTRTVLQLLAIGSLIGSGLWIFRPFLAAILRATAIAVATWPVLLRVQLCLRGRRFRGWSHEYRPAPNSHYTFVVCDDRAC